jgi:hypothetical protein
MKGCSKERSDYEWINGSGGCGTLFLLSVDYFAVTSFVIRFAGCGQIGTGASIHTADYTFFSLSSHSFSPSAALEKKVSFFQKLNLSWTTFQDQASDYPYHPEVLIRVDLGELLETIHPPPDSKPKSY